MPSQDKAIGGLIEVAPGVRRMTAPNPGPMTADGTHSFVLGRNEVVVVDPGPAGGEGHVEALLAALGRERVAGIALTHNHTDHAGALPALSRATGARPATPAMLKALGVEVIAAPGHTSDHSVFRSGDVVLSGDHVFQATSTFIDWPDGTLDDFLATSRRLLALSHLTFHPAHGPPLGDARARLTWLIDHREGRNTAILASLGDGPMDRRAIFDRVYADTPYPLRSAATRNLAAHLEYLERRGVLAVEGTPNAPLFRAIAP